VKLERTKTVSTNEEKDLGEDDSGRPMVRHMTYRRWTFQSDIDVRAGLGYRKCAWDSCHWVIVEGSELHLALLEGVFSWNRHPDGYRRLPHHCMVYSVSDDGLTFELRWR